MIDSEINSGSTSNFKSMISMIFYLFIIVIVIDDFTQKLILPPDEVNPRLKEKE